MRNLSPCFPSLAVECRPEDEYLVTRGESRAGTMTVETDIAFMRESAAQARRLAAHMDHLEAIRTLSRFAVGQEAEANALEATTVPPGGKDPAACPGSKRYYAQRARYYQDKAEDAALFVERVTKKETKRMMLALSRDFVRMAEMMATLAGAEPELH